MRKEPFTTGDYVHVYNRGNRKMPIVHGDKDKWRFMQVLRYFNDEKSSLNVLRDLQFGTLKSDFNVPESVFTIGWPKEWRKHSPLVKILCYCLMPNHFHLLLREIREGGVSKFMQKLGVGYTNYYNLKYHEVGSLFQGGYKARRVDSDLYLRYLSVYIQVINCFELYPGGFHKALKEAEEALEFSVNYPFCSLVDYIGRRKSLIIDKDILGEFFPTPRAYKAFIKDTLMAQDFEEVLGPLRID